MFISCQSRQETNPKMPLTGEECGDFCLVEARGYLLFRKGKDGEILPQAKAGRFRGTLMGRKNGEERDSNLILKFAGKFESRVSLYPHGMQKGIIPEWV